MRSLQIRLLSLMAALAVASCAAPPPIDSSRLPASPPKFREADTRWIAATPTDGKPGGEWWKAFGDPVLDDLMSQAMARNDRIQVAVARLVQANALVRNADAQKLPQAGLSAGASRGSSPQDGRQPLTQITAGASFSYEADVFGKLSRVSDAARLDAESREALLRSAQLLVQADVAQTYFALRNLDVESAIVGETVGAYRDTLRLTELRLRAGDIAELDVERVRAETAVTESEALAIRRQRAQLEHALAVLVGSAASNFAVEEAPWHADLPVVPPGLPATVLMRRPDVAAAQRQLLAAQARVGVAQAAWFPDVQLTANGGYAASSVSDVFRWSARSWGVGALLSLPLLDGGRRNARIDAAKAEMDGATATYREQVLVAFQDVEDQLSSLRLLADQAGAESRAVTSSSRATLLSSSRYRNGLISQLELLDAQRSELRSRRDAAQVRAAQYQATVGLIRALGGAWDGPPGQGVS